MVRDGGGGVRWRGRWEGGREGKREGGREGGRERGREGGKEGGRKMEIKGRDMICTCRLGGRKEVKRVECVKKGLNYIHSLSYSTFLKTQDNRSP